MKKKPEKNMESRNIKAGRKQGALRKRLAGAAAVLAAGVMAAGCGQPKGATTAQKEFVYVPEYVKLEIQDNMDMMKVSGDTLYFVSSNWDEQTSTYQKYLGKMKIGGTAPEKVPLDISDEEYTMASYIDENGELSAIVVRNLYDGDAAAEAGSAGEDGDAEDGAQEAENGEESAAEGEAAAEDTAEEAVKEAAEEEKTGAAEEKEAESGTESEAESETESETDGEGAEPESADSEEEPAVSGGESGSVTIISGTGSFSTTAVASSSSYGASEYTEPTGQTVELRKFGADGKAKESVNLDSVMEEQADTYVQYLLGDNQGNTYIGYDQTITVLDKDGKKLFDLQVDNWINSMFATADGQVLVSYWGDGVEVHTIDLAAKKMGDKIEALSEIRFGNYTFASGRDTDLLFSAESDLYSYNFGDAQAQKLLNWIDCDVDENDIQCFSVLEDGRILVITSNWDGESDANRVELVYLTKKKGSEVPEKKILTYGTLMLDYDIRKQILEFNKTNQEYRIEVKEYYTDYSAEDAYTNAVQRMNSDIVSGQCPDIIDISTGNVQSYISKGVVADLYPFMDKDEEINREDYLESILKAYEKNGKLYAMPSAFFISTMMAKVSDVGDRQSITLDEVMELSKGLPEGAELYQYASKSSVLSSIMRMNMDVYANWETGECKFNSEEFIKALEFANTFPAEFNWDADRPSAPTMIREGKLIMMDVSISSMQEYQMYKGMYGEPVTFIGYPTSKESGSFIISNGSLPAMSAKSPYQEGVWQFIRTRITKEAQESDSGYRYGFPVMKSALEKQFADDMEDEYYEDENGTKHKQSKTTWGYDDFQIEIFAATEEEVAAVRKLIESVNSSYQFDTQMFTIIEEEAGAFFEGQKSAKDVADIIQSRIQIYVNENR